MFNYALAFDQDLGWCLDDDVDFDSDGEGSTFQDACLRDPVRVDVVRRRANGQLPSTPASTLAPTPAPTGIPTGCSWTPRRSIRTASRASIPAAQPGLVQTDSRAHLDPDRRLPPVTTRAPAAATRMFGLRLVVQSGTAATPTNMTGCARPSAPKDIRRLGVDRDADCGCDDHCDWGFEPGPRLVRTATTPSLDGMVLRGLPRLRTSRLRDWW